MVATWENTPKANRPLQIAETTGFSETFPFPKDYILEKENIHIPWKLLDFTGTTFQDKGKYSTQYNYSILQLK